MQKLFSYDRDEEEVERLERCAPPTITGKFTKRYARVFGTLPAENLNLSRTVAGITKWLLVTIKGISKLPPAKM